MVTIRTESSMRPQTPLFSPINSSTRPYSQTSSSTQRPLMMPDELLRMDRSKSILLVGGQKPLELYKITPEEIPGFEKLKPTRVTDHIPAWREIEAERERAGCIVQKSAPEYMEDTMPSQTHGTITAENAYLRQEPEIDYCAPRESASSDLPYRKPDAQAPEKRKSDFAEVVAEEYKVQDFETTDDIMNFFVGKKDGGNQIGTSG